MKSFIRFFAIIFWLSIFVFSSKAQTTVQIGTGTSTTYQSPLNMYYNYSWNRILYSSSEVGNIGPIRITKIAFQYAYTTSSNATNQTCYLQATTSTSLSGATAYVDPISGGATQVWAGTLNCVQGWVEITLTTPFILPAGSNLLLYWNDHQGSYAGSAYVFNYTTASNMVVYARSDGSFPSGTTGTLSSERPNTRITWMPLGRTASVTEISSPSSNKISWGANLQATAKIANAGIDTITSCRVNWKVNEVTRTPIFYNTPLIEGANPVSVNLGTYTPDSNVRNNITVWVDNATPYDSISSDDTLSLDFYACTYTLNGNYTVGGLGADFMTLDHAVDHLMNCGVSGPTTFLISNGMYEPISLEGAIPGASTTNTVTFTSATGQANMVTIGYGLNPSATALYLKDIDHLIFKDITIGLNSIYTGYAVDMEGMCENILFHGCNIQTYAAGTDNAYVGVRYYSASGAITYLKDVRFIKNRIDGGYYNFWFYYPAGGSANMGATGMSVTIDSNELTNAYYYGIYSYYYARYPSISYNTITSRNSGSVSSVWYGMYLYYYQNVENIVGNKIKSTNTSISSPYGMYLYYYLNTTSYSGTGRVLVANNEITLYTVNAYYGLYLYYPYSDLQLLHNSVYMYGSGNCYGLYLDNTTTTYRPVVKNNNIVTAAGASAYPVYYNGAYYNSSYFDVDYNNYYSTGDNVGYAASMAQTTLEGLRGATMQDVNSVNKAPTYIDYPNSLAIYGYDLACPLLNNVQTDINNIARTSTTVMGAHQFVPSYANDVQPYSLVTPSMVVMRGQRETVSIEIINLGTDTLTSATINWSFNGVAQSPVLWTGSILSGATATVTMDTIVPIGGLNTLRFVTSIPNGQADAMPMNDTLAVELFACDSMLHGTYTVGTGGQFTTVEDAIMTLSNCGMDGPVVFSFLNGSYGTVSLTGNINGLSAINTVTFTAASGVASDVVIGSSTTSDATALKLIDAKHLIFKDITIGTNSTYTGYAVDMMGMCENILFYGCNIQTYQNGTSTTYAGVRYYSASGATVYLKDVHFIKNKIDGGYYNFWFYYPAGGTANMGAMSVTIDSNELTNAYYYGIYSYYYARYNSISYNTITSRNSGSVSSTWYGMYLYYYQNVNEIVGNKIKSTNTSIDLPYGIYIHYHFNRSDYSGSGSGLVANNEIILRTTGTRRGLHLNMPYSNPQLVHNSIYMYGTGNCYALYLYNTNTTYKPVIKNNNLVTAAGASAYPIYYNGSYYNTSYFDVDYNNYYSTGNNVGYAGAARTTLSALRTATLQDANSTNMNPGHAAEPTDLIPSNWSMCPVYPGVSADINGDSRIGVTYKGCYTASFDNDASLTEFVDLAERSTSGSNSIKVRLTNMGTDTLKSVGVQCSVDGVLQPAVNLTGLSLARYQDTVVTLGTFTAVTGNTTVLKAWSFTPNGIADENLYNDTISLSTIGCALVFNGTYDIGGGNNDFSQLSDVLTALANCGVSGPVVFRLASGTYTNLNNINMVYYGTNATNTVTFTSLSGNADSVIVGSASGVALSLDGAKHLKFKHITIGNNNTTYGVNFENTNTTEDVEFYGCVIKSNPTTTSSSYAAIYFNNTSGSNNLLKDVRFIKNTIDGGYYNIYFYYPAGGSANTGANGMSVTIDSNIIQNAYYYAIYSYEYARYNSISYNTITSRNSGSVSSYWNGIYLSWDHNVEYIVGNKIKSTNTSIGSPRGMYLYYYLNSPSYSGSGSGLVANNEIILYTTGTYHGVYLYMPYSNVQFVHNSIYMYGTGNCYGLYLYNSSASYKPVIQNNNLVTNAGATAYPMYYNGAYYNTTYFDVDYNNYYNMGGLNIAYAGSAITNLMGLRSATSQDANSLSEDPGFLTPTVSLHTNGATMLIDPITDVPEDIDGKPRLGVTNMGCYHNFVPKDVDVKMEAIVSPIASVKTGQSTDIEVQIKNLGINTIDSVDIHYVINGTEQVYKWYGSLTFNKTSPKILLGSFIPVGGTNTLVVFTKSPNGVQDEFTANDTLYKEVYACDSLLSGVYIVGGVNADMQDEKEVVGALVNCGIKGSVEFRFNPGDYGPMNFDKEILGASSTRTILFTSTTGSASSVRFIDTLGINALTLVDASNMNFEYVTFDASAFTGASGVEFKGSCSNIEFYACNILSDPTTSSTSKCAVRREGFSGSTDKMDNIRLIKNNISGGYYNIRWYYGGGGSTYMGNNCVIDSNICTDAYYYSIDIYYSYTNFNSISYNKVTCRTANTTSYFYGIRIYYYNNVARLVGNRVYVCNPAIGYTYPIYVYYYNNYTNNSYGPMLIANNEIITDVGTNGYGIYVYMNSPSKVINNSIYVSAGSTAYGLYLYNTNTTYPIIAKNNNVHVATASTGYPLYISNASYANPSYVTLDYNNYYSTGNYVGYVGTAMSTLSTLRSATTQDTHSVSVAPIYLDSTYSLELSDYSAYLCDRDVDVMDDINKEPRTMLTPMGAYTVDIYEGYDMAINAMVEPVNTSDVFCYQDFASIRVAIQNKGSYNIDYASQPMSMHVEVTGAVNFQADTLIVSGGLSPTKKDTVTITDLLPVANNGSYNMKIWLSLPLDTLYYDDTIQYTYVIDKIELPYNVNFDSIPKGLVFKQIAGSAGWSVEQGSGSNPTIAPSHGSGRLQFASASDRGSLASVTLQPINLRGTAQPKLDFWYAHDDAPGRDYTDVKISIDGGFTYSTLLSIRRSDPAYTTPTFVRYTVDLTPYTNYSCVIIGFEAGSFAGGNQNIDSISVSSLEDISLDIKVVEQDDFVACELDNKPLIVSLTNLTTQNFNFTDKPTQIDVEVSGAVNQSYTYPLTSGILPGDTTLDYMIDSVFDFSSYGLYTIKAHLRSVDDNTSNDTLEISRLINADIELIAIAPIDDKAVGDEVYPMISVKNVGNMPISEVPLRMLINNQSVVTEVISDFLYPGDSISYTFINSYTVPAVSQSQPFYLLEIRTELSCDGVASNNSKSGYYNVILDEYIDLAITEVVKPNEIDCDTGKSVVYPVVKINNLGTGLANNITLYVTIDSAGNIVKSYSESITYILANDSITYTCATGYNVPNFDGNYKVTLFVNVAEDNDMDNNTVEVNACAIKAVGVEDIDRMVWTLGQNIPNPSINQTRIPFSVPVAGEVTFELTTINGQVLHREQLQAITGSNFFDFTTESLSNGIYYYSMEYKGQRIVKKMTIQK